MTKRISACLSKSIKIGGNVCHAELFVTFIAEKVWYASVILQVS